MSLTWSDVDQLDRQGVGRALDGPVSDEHALADGGITFGPWECFRPHVESGALVPLLEPYLPPFPGFLLYYPQRQHIAPKLRALVDHVRRWPG